MGCKTYDFGEYKRKKDKQKKKNSTNVPKYKTDGTLKQTISNSKKDRETVEPLKIDDVAKIIEYFKSKFKNSYTEKKKYTNLRNLAIFTIGINIGLRIGDLLSLKWSDIYNEDWEFNEYKTITPEKTESVNKKVLLSYNKVFRLMADKYKETFKPTNLDGYVFRKGLNDFNPISYDAFQKALKKAVDNVGINYPVNTHSMRKTFARQRYDNATNKEEVLVALMKLFNHSSTVITLKYIGITKEEQIDLYNEVCLGEDFLQELD